MVHFYMHRNLIDIPGMGRYEIVKTYKFKKSWINSHALFFQIILLDKYDKYCFNC